MISTTAVSSHEVRYRCYIRGAVGQSRKAGNQYSVGAGGQNRSRHSGHRLGGQAPPLGPAKRAGGPSAFTAPERP